MIKNFKIEFKWAMFFTLLNLLWLYAEKALGWHDESIGMYSIYSMALSLPLIAIVYLCIREKNEKIYHHKIDWRKAFISGAIFSGIVAGFSPVPVFVLSEFVSPEFFNKAVITAVENGTEQSSAETLYNMGAFTRQAMFGNLATGVFWSAIIALFFKKKEAK
ncbi:MAG: DUF4199 domain-containing protein [Psychroflexus salarius]